MRYRALAAAAIAVFLSGPAFAQAIQQSGPVIPGHVPVFIGNGQVSDGGYSSGGNISAIGITGTNMPFCITDAPTSGAYHQLCLGANATTGGGLLSYGAFGGASVLPFEFLFNGNAIVFSGGSLTLGTANTTQGSLVLEGGTSGAVTITTAANAGTYNFVLPQTSGAANAPLVSGGGGSTPMSFGTISGNTSEFASVTGSLTSGHCVVADAFGNLEDNGSGCGGSGTVNSGTATYLAYYASTGTAVSASSAITISGSVVTINPPSLSTMNNVTIGATTPAAITGTTVSANSALSAGISGTQSGTLAVAGGGSGTISIKPQSAAGTYNFNLPITAGTSGYVLLSAGGGSSPMTWGAPSGNTTTFATLTGSTTSGHSVIFDGSGNIEDSGSAPSGTINSGTAGQLTYYAGSGTTVSGNANMTVSSGALTVGVTGAAAGSVIFSGSSTGAVTVKGSTTTVGTYNFNLPATAGSASDPLLSGGGGSTAMSWGTVSGTTTKFGTVSGSLVNGDCIAADANGNLIDNGGACGSGGSGTVTSSTAGQIAYYAASNNAVAGNSSLTISGGAVTIGVTGTTAGSLKLSGSSTGTITIIGSTTTIGTYNFNMPTTAGSSGQVLTSGGGGSTAMSWTSPGTTCCTNETSAFNASANTGYTVDTTGGAVTVTLEASPAGGDTYLFLDAKNNWAATNFTVAPNGNTIMNVSGNMTVSTVNGNFHMVWDSTNSTWDIY